MKKRNLLFGLLALTLLSTSVLVQPSSKANVNIAWQAVDFGNSYEINSTIFAPEREVTIAGETFTVMPKIVFPSKKVVHKCSATLDEIGTYSIVYEITYNGEAYSDESHFTVESKLFDIGPSSSAYYGMPDMAKEHKGLVFNLAQGEEIMFNKPIDVHNFTSDDYIISGYIAPKVRGEYDFEKLLITFYDSENPDIWYRQHIRRRDMVSTSGINPLGHAYYYGGGNGQGTAGANVKEADPQAINKNNEWGPMSHLPFDGIYNVIYNDGGEKEARFENNPIDDYLFRISMDMQGYEVYTTEFQRDRTGQFVEGPNKVVKHFITDLDNPNFYPTLFSGFPSGKIKVGITADMYNKEFAQFVITDIASLDLTEDVLHDNDGPVLTIDNVYGEEMPLAQAGYSYLIPSAHAVDEICGESDVNVSVYFNYGSEKQQKISIRDNRFNTGKVGWYTIEYNAKDSFGNATVKLLNVFCGKTIPELTINIDSPETSIYLGKYLKPANFTVTNNSGQYETKITIIDPSGNETEYIEGENFAVEAQGEWEVEYKVTDMIGRTAIKSYKMNATISEKPILREEGSLTLPKALIAGGIYELPTLTAVQYHDDFDYDEYDCDLDVSYNGGEPIEVYGELEVENYLENGIPIKCTYSCEDTTLHEEIIPYVSGLRYDEPDPDYPMKLNLLNYYIGNNFTYTQDAVGEGLGVKAEVKADAEQSTFYFANPILSDKFSLTLKTFKGYDQYSGMDIKLIDYENKNNTVTANITYTSLGAVMTVDGVAKNINVSKLADGSFTISYFDNQVTIEDPAITNFDIVHNDAGLIFEGFPSHKAYVEVTLLDAKANDYISVAKINNHSMSNNNKDIDDTVPQYVFIGNHGGTYSLGSVYHSPVFIAHDVIAPNVESSLRIAGPSTIIGRDLDPTQSYDVSLDELGSYTLTFNAQETYANDDFTEADARPISIKDIVYAIDNIPPTITITSEMPTEGKINDIVPVSDFTVTDNIDPEDKIIKTRMIIAPNGLVQIIPDTIKRLKLTMYGTYVIRYMAQDSQGNLAIASHYINVI